MDHPIIYTYDTPRPPLKKKAGERFAFSLLCAALSHDDKDEFMRLIKDPEFCPSYNANFVFGFDCLKCAIAVLDGETKGIIDMEDVLKHGITPLHIAARRNAPKLIKYLLERGHNVDVLCHKHVTPLDLAVEALQYRNNEQKSVSGLFFWIFYHKRDSLETLRMLVQKTKDKERVREAFIDFARKGQSCQFTMLFLAAPELLSSSLVMLYLEKRTDIEEQLSLLIDVFATVGDKLIAYVRLQEFWNQGDYKTHLDIDFFLREAARKKLGFASPDYFIRFYVTPGGGGDDDDDDDDEEEEEEEEEEQQCSNDDYDYDYDDDYYIHHDMCGQLCSDDDDGDDDHGRWKSVRTHDMFACLEVFVTRKNIDKTFIYRKLPTLKPEDAGCLNRAIKKKLSSMSPLYCYLETNPIPKGLSFPHGRSFVPLPAMRSQSFCTSAAGAKFKFDFNFTPANKEMKPTEVKSIFFGIKPSHFRAIANRLIK